MVLKSGFASRITTVVDLETSDGDKIRSFSGSAQICHVDISGYNGTSHAVWVSPRSRQEVITKRWRAKLPMMPRQSSTWFSSHPWICVHTVIWDLFVI